MSTNISQALADDLSPADIPLNQLFLDPNNPRFVGSGWQEINSHDTTDEDVQEIAATRLRSSFGVDKLRSNMEINGYLPIDRIVVRSIGEQEYLVLEGNRRICAAKDLAKLEPTESGIPSEIFRSLRKIPALVYTGSDPQAAWTFQGLRHISGINEWPAYNKARLLVTQMENEDLSFTEVGRRFGLSGHGAGQWVRGYSAFIQAKEESDFSEELDEKAYPFFQELFSRSSIGLREWMDWDDTELRFTNLLRFNEFVGWLYPRNEEDPEDSLGDWNNRRLRVRDDLRSLTYVLGKDSESFEEFRRGDIPVDGAYARVVAREHEKNTDRQSEVFDSIEACASALNNLPFRMLVDEETKADLIRHITALQSAISKIEEAASL